MGNITDLIKDVASKNQIIETFAAKVIQINNETESLHNPEDAYTVNIMRADGAILKNVRLKASIQDLEQGIITIPKKDSWVLATIIDGVETRAFISQFSEVDRVMGRIQDHSDSKLYVDYSADGNKLHIRYMNTDSETETDETKIVDVAKIEFDKDRNFKISYFDDNENPLAITHFTPDSLTTTFNSIENKEIKERLALTVSKDAVSFKFKNNTGKELNSMLATPEKYAILLKTEEDKKQSSFAIEKNKIAGYLFEDDELKKLAFELNGDADSIRLKKDDQNLIELKGKTAITLKTEGDINIEAKNINIKSTEKININATGDTIISGDNVKIN
ncbi:hypothetical protein [Flavobacterium aquidurense]|uniref:Gp5/Type VI secretion system Vgr protein OB-fold domain-containing protein n=1 Tax=Flavobacterium aquidurense TaxID=362413 RepID=A0A0Q0XTG5_9FLAO|nr:hypothetical protein [Flavobacterium aquidurense]KQB39469.1 hypothetical protein RC62_1150 [Flavobacterium aquidurense]